MNNEDKQKIEKIELDILLKKYITNEDNQDATNLKLELIKQLLNNKISYINVISYYYDILNLQDK